ncbi:MAG TPA: hypothetical protein D7I01_06240 [Candidatus Poseidoniales archaeon]|nr:MAG TPA: hypothetical protein D7I01_06240 [Candidatus Poseidoniales archaeon]
MTEQEGVQGGGVSADQVVNQAFDLTGRHADFACFRCTCRVAQTEQNVLDLAVRHVRLFLEQAMQQGHGTSQMKHRFLEVFEGLLRAKNGLQRTAEAVAVQVRASFCDVKFSAREGIDLPVEHRGDGRIEVLACRRHGRTVFLFFERDVLETLLLQLLNIEVVPLIRHIGVFDTLHRDVVQGHGHVFALGGLERDLWLLNVLIFRHRRPPPVRPNRRSR